MIATIKESFEFDELSEDAKEKALEELWNSDEWWDYRDELIDESMEVFLKEKGYVASLIVRHSPLVGFEIGRLDFKIVLGRIMKPLAVRRLNELRVLPDYLDTTQKGFWYHLEVQNDSSDPSKFSLGFWRIEETPELSEVIQNLTRLIKEDLEDLNGQLFGIREDAIESSKYNDRIFDLLKSRSYNFNEHGIII